MNFKVTKASDCNYKGTVEINSLEDLLAFIEENGVIIMGSRIIKIYDDYVE